MTSIIPLSTPQIYSTLTDDTYECCYKKKHIPNNTLKQFINCDSRFSIFNCILEKSGINIFDDCYDYTMFIPTNEYLECFDYNNLDKSTARNIVFASVLNHKIPSGILKSTNYSYYETLNPVQNLIISVCNEYININANSTKCIKVINEDICLSNGIIHIIDDIIIPYMV